MHTERPGIHVHQEEWHRGASRAKRRVLGKAVPTLSSSGVFSYLTKTGDSIPFSKTLHWWLISVTSLKKKKTSKEKWQVLKFQVSKCQEDPVNKAHCEIRCQHLLGIFEICLLAMDDMSEKQLDFSLPKSGREGITEDITPCPSADRLLWEHRDIFEVVPSSVFSSAEALLVCPVLLLKITLRWEAPDHRWRISFRGDSMSASVKVVIAEVPQGQTPGNLHTLQICF